MWDFTEYNLELPSIDADSLKDMCEIIMFWKIVIQDVKKM